MIKFLEKRQTLFDKVVFRKYKCKQTTQLIIYNLKQHITAFLEDFSAELFEIMYYGNYSEIQDYLIKNDILDEFDTFVEELIQEGILNDEKELNHIISNLEFKNPDNQSISEFYEILYENGYLFNLHIDVTNKCNVRCKHCYHPFEEYSYENEMDLEAIKKLIDDAYEKGVFVIILSGGEPLLRKDISSIMEYITQKGMCIDLFTNATLMTRSYIQEMQNFNINRVSISIYSTDADIHDAITQVKGSLSKTMDAIDELIIAGFQVELKCVMMKDNFDSYRKLREYAHAKGVKLLLDTSMTPKLNSEQSPVNLALSYDQYLKLCLDTESSYYVNDLGGINPEQIACNAGRYSMYCDSEGVFYPCVSFRLKLGNIKLGLSDAKNNSELKKWMKMKNREYEGYNKHSYCKFCVEICAGISQLENGDYRKCEKSDCYKAKVREEAFHMCKGVNTNEKIDN